MKKNYLMEIIREEISSYLGENEPMYASPQDQQREVNGMLNQVENLKKLRDELDAQIAQLEVIANTFNVNEDAAANKSAMDAKKTAIDKEIAALNKQKQELSKPGSSLNEDNDISISGSDWEDIGLGRVITKFNDGVKISWNEDDPNLYHARVYGLNGKDENIYIDFLRKVNAEKQELGENNQLDEETLNEMAFSLKKGLAPSEKLEPRYKKENFKKVVDLILSKVDGKKTMADVARELGVIQQKIRPVISDLIDAGILETGEAESKSGKDVPNKPGRKATEKPAAAPKAEKPAAAKAAPAKAEPKAKMEPEDKADAAAMKAATKSKGGTTRAEKYGMLRNELERVTAELKSLAGSPDMETRKKLSADKMRIELAMDKLKQVNI